MLRRLIARIDALGDRVHPVVVLQLRRYFRNVARGYNFLAWTILLAAAAIGVIVYEDVIFAVPKLDAYRRGLYDNTPFMWMVGPFIGFQLFFGVAPALCFRCWVLYWRMKWADPLMVTTSMSERKFYAGYYYQVSSWEIFSGLVYFLPYLTFAYLLRLIPLSWVLFYPFIFVAVGWTLGNICYPIALASRTLFQRIVLSVLAVLFFALVFVVGFGVTMTMITAPLGIPFRGALPFVTTIGMELRRFELWFPVFLVAVPAYSCTAWRLIDYNLDRRRSFWRKLFRSLGVYALLTALLIGLWFALRFCLGGV